MSVTDNWVDIVHGFYPRGVPFNDPRYDATVEIQRLSKARRDAAEHDERWRALLTQLETSFPDCYEVQNRSHHLAGGLSDACYTGRVFVSYIGEPARSFRA